MYRVSPFTYLVSAVLSTGLANAPVTCSSIELLNFDPPSGQTCATYLKDYLLTADGKIVNPEATSNCRLCPLSTTNSFLELVNSNYSDRWRNFGILWVYVFVNIAMALFFYWLVRVPKSKKGQDKKGEKSVVANEKPKDIKHQK
jgi:ATP-binding cassette subfamily G (WHITE) protein 2 (PDR)